MKLFLISDNIDTEAGMRMAGIDGIVVHEKEEVTKALYKAVSDPDIAIVLMTKKLVDLCADVVYDLKLSTHDHLIVEIPDRHGASSVAGNIEKYIKEAIGISI